MKHKEHRRWKFASACVIAILLLLGPFGRAVEALVEGWLRQYPQLTYGTAASISLAIIFLWLRQMAALYHYRFRTTILHSMLLAGFLYLCSVLLYSRAEWSHIVFYGALSYSLRRSGLSLVVCFLSSTSFGLFEEWLQGLSPRRIFDPRDVGLNALGSVFGLLAAYAPSQPAALALPSQTADADAPPNQ
jgi:hypothetical protein